MPSDIQIRKVIAGTLLFGASALSGDATLLASAGALGVNWASEALASLWQQQRAQLLPGTPITQAATRAIRRAASTLKERYSESHGSRVDLRAFDLIRDCAGSVSEAGQQPTGPMAPAAVEEVLSSALSDLLHGHDEQAVAFIKRELLGEVTRAFRQQLAEDTEAWQSFHGWLIERMAMQVEALSGKLERLQEVREHLTEQHRALEALEGAAERLEELITQLQQARAAAAGATVSFQNTDVDAQQLMQAGGDIIEGRGPAPSTSRSTGTSVSFGNNRVRAHAISQAGGSIYRDSAVVQGGGDAESTSPPPAPSKPGGREGKQ